MLGDRIGFRAGTVLFCWAALSSWGSAIETDFHPTVELLTPVGEYYDVTVPDTLDLAERGRLAVHGLTSFLNDKKNYEPYGHGFFNTDPPYLNARFAQGPDGGGRRTGGRPTTQWC